jgi:hypothetical protein
MKQVFDGIADILVITPESLTSGEGLNVVKIIDDASSIIWTRKLMDCDEFEIVVPSTYENFEALQTDMIILVTDYGEIHDKHGYNIRLREITKREINDAIACPYISGDVYPSDDDIVYKYTDLVGIIEKVDVKPSNTKEGVSDMTISGRSLESLLERRITWDPYTLEIYDGESTNLYQRLIGNIYAWLVKNMIAPGKPDKVSRKSPIDPEEFQNRAIWNFVMGSFTDGDDSAHQDNYLRELPAFYIPEGETKINPTSMDLLGDSLLDTVKQICETYGLGLRSYLIPNVDMNAIGLEDGGIDTFNALNLGKYKEILSYGPYDASQDNRNLVIPGVCSWVFLEFYVPYNRSYEDNGEENPFVIFSQNMDNLKDVQFVKDDGPVRNVTKILGITKNEKTTIEEVVFNSTEEPTGWKRKEMFTDATNSPAEKNGKDNAYIRNTYKPALRALGRKNLLQNSRNRNYVYDGSPIIGLEDSFYVYGEDYTIGDYVQFFDEIFNESIKTQVSEVIESIDGSGYYMTISYDTPIVDFDEDDPLRYYYYTIDDENMIITITGIKLGKVMEDGLTDLPILPFDAIITKGGKQKKKKINKGVSYQYPTNNPDEDKAIKTQFVDTTGCFMVSSAGADQADWWPQNPSVVTYNGYQIKLNLTYSH